MRRAAFGVDAAGIASAIGDSAVVSLRDVSGALDVESDPKFKLFLSKATDRGYFKGMSPESS